MSARVETMVFDGTWPQVRDGLYAQMCYGWRLVPGGLAIWVEGDQPMSRRKRERAAVRLQVAEELYSLHVDATLYAAAIEGLSGFFAELLGVLQGHTPKSLAEPTQSDSDGSDRQS